jgi:ADP-ribose pyrophosphatase
MTLRDTSKETVELIRHEVAFQGYFKVGRYSFRHSLFGGGTSKIIVREVFERGQAAAVLLFDARRDEVVLIRQFRAGSYVAGRHSWTWEIVAGIIEEGESGGDLVKREAIEEAGLAVTDLLPIYQVMLTPGACSESCEIFLGRTDTSKAGGVHGLASENEDILVKALAFAEARAMMERGEFDNAVAVIAMQWLVLHRDEVRRRWA